LAAGDGIVSLAPLRSGKRLALVGDSVTRYMFVDLAVELFSCDIGWDGATCGGSRGASAGGSACSSLESFVCQGKRHESLTLTHGRTTLLFVWAPFAEQLQHAAFRGLLSDPSVDGIALSLGFWDVAKDVGGGSSVAHHCAWMHTTAFLSEAKAANLRLEEALLFWQPPATGAIFAESPAL